MPRPPYLPHFFYVIQDYVSVCEIKIQIKEKFETTYVNIYIQQCTLFKKIKYQLFLKYSFLKVTFFEFRFFQ